MSDHDAPASEQITIINAGTGDWNVPPREWHDIEAWATVIESVLELAPHGDHATILSCVKSASDKIDGFRTGLGSDIEPTPPALWSRIMQLKSLVVQVFVRTIANNHSE